jgi:hypothetical protein
MKADRRGRAERGPRDGEGPIAAAGGVVTPAIPVFLYHSVMDDPPDWIAEFTVTP